MVLFALALIVICGSILPWSVAHHERNWFVYRLRGDRLRIEGDLLRSQQFYDSALHEAEFLRSKEKMAASRADLEEVAKLRQKRMQSATALKKKDPESAEEEDALEVKTDPREIPFEWDSYANVRSRLASRNAKRTRQSIFTILLTKENSNAGQDPIRLNEIGDCNMMIGHFSDAEDIFRRSCNASEGQSEDVGIFLAGLDRLAQCQWARQEFAAALDTSEKAVSLSRQSAPKKYTQYLNLHRAQILLQCDRFAESEKLCLDVLKDPNDIGMENRWYPLLLLGQSRIGKHAYAEAIEPLSTSLSILDTGGDPFDIKVNRVCMALAEARAMSNQPEQAKKLYTRAIDVYWRNGGSRNNNLDTMAARYGHQYCAVNRYDIAAFCYKWAAELRQEKFGKNNYKVGVQLNNYAMALDHIGQHKMAEEARLKAQSMKEGREQKEAASRQ